jgi:hypothetical protein
MRRLVACDTGPRGARGSRPPAAGKARIILADHERLVVSYSTQDDTVYVLAPPGADPRAVLRTARLVLHDDAYQELASHLGVAPGWPADGWPAGGWSADGWAAGGAARGGRWRGPRKPGGPVLPGGPPHGLAS